MSCRSPLRRVQLFCGTALGLTVLLAAPALAVPLPPDKPPVPSAAADAIETAALPAGASVEALQRALAAADRRDLDEARALSADLSPLDRRLVEWMLIRRDAPELTSGMITAFAAEVPSWPNVALMRRRAESALLRERAAPDAVVAAFGDSAPITQAGVLALARAHLALGNRDAAAAVVAPFWRTELLEPDEETRFLAEFDDLLGEADHEARFDLLMYADRVSQAGALARRLGDGYVALATARAAMLRRDAVAAALLERLPDEVATHPLALFTRIERLRLAGDSTAAGQILLAAPTDPATVGDADAWWIERRIVSRDLLEAGEAEVAYRIAAAHRGGTPETQAEAAFHAGWYALRFLDDPAQARPHFEALLAVGTRAHTRARALYWMGRTEEAAGNDAAGAARYREASAYPTTYYGQLALASLQASDLGLPPVPAPGDADRAAFRQNEMVRALARLIEAGREDDTALLFTELARQLATPGELTLLAEMAERRGNHRMVLQIGKIAMDRGLPVAALAYPLDAIPAVDRDGGSVEMALVYAIARQESAFDPTARSGAGALGLLQLMPGTARMVARDVGLAYAESRLTGDPGYNAELGSAHLRDLVEDYGGSYIMTFAAYNAGPGRVREWVARFGDPRRGDVDPVDWVEQISYGETRDYVQRVMENLQVYRERLDGGGFAIMDDLRRGG